MKILLDLILLFFAILLVLSVVFLFLDLFFDISDVFSNIFNKNIIRVNDIVSFKINSKFKIGIVCRKIQSKEGINYYVKGEEIGEYYILKKQRYIRKIK